jgi:uncharacterized protein (TIGR02001 family)
MPLVATAQTAPAPAAAAPASPHTFSFNVGATTDYRYRGISQSGLKPAASAGADYSHSSGLYLGVWASTIKWIKDAGGGANAEIDLYGGYKFNISKDVGLDVGLLTYQYPSNGLTPSTNTLEWYVAASYGIGTLKYSNSTSNLFGFANSKRSGYWEINTTSDLGDGLTVTGHLGYQSVKNNSAFSYLDYKVGVTKDVAGYLLGAALVGTDSKAYLAPSGKNLGKTGVVLSVSKTF